MASLFDKVKGSVIGGALGGPAGVPLGLAHDLYKQYGRNKKHKVRIAGKPKPLIPGGKPRNPAVVGGTGAIDYTRGGQGTAGKRASQPITTSSDPSQINTDPRRKKKGQASKNADAVQGVMDDLNEYG